MLEYHKIQTVFLRDMEHNSKRLKIGWWSKPEFEYLQSNLWQCDEKIDGTNIRVMFDGENIKFGGRTDAAKTPGDLLDNLAKIFNSVDTFKELFPPRKNPANQDEILPTNVVLYGEGFGPGIQKGGGNYTQKGLITGKSFILFDVYANGIWLERADVHAIAQRLSCLFTPEVFRGSLLECIEFAEAGYTSQFGDFIAEGIIARPVIEMKNRRGERVITKLKYCDFGHLCNDDWKPNDTPE